MWEKFRQAKIKKAVNKEELREGGKCPNVNEEYLSALRTKSYSKSEHQYYCISSNNDVSLEAVLSKTPKLKTLMLHYFHISAEASSICTQLLRSINQIQCDSGRIFELNIFDSSELMNSSVHEKLSSVLQCLNKSRERVSKKMKLVPFKGLSSMMFGSGDLRKALDWAAKGIYILKREFETMSRLVTRLSDSIQHHKAMRVRSCQSRFCNDQLVNELKKSDLGLRKQVEELQEHVFLCLVTTNRATALLLHHIIHTNKP